VTSAPIGIVFVYEFASALEAVVTVAEIVHVLLAGIVPPDSVTVRVGEEPGRETVPPTQLVVGVPLNCELLSGVVGKVSENGVTVLTCRSEPVELVKVMVRVSVAPASKLEKVKALLTLTVLTVKVAVELLLLVGPVPVVTEPGPSVLEKAPLDVPANGWT